MAFSSISGLWNEWNIRCFIILSLSLQVFLILFAPFRKKTANARIIALLWLAYLMADWVAGFGIGLICHNQGNSSARAAEVDGALQAFWASFLLFHLGGLDTITAFSLEDSSLWRRHLLGLLFRVVATIYVFVQIFPSNKSLVIPTILVFFAAVIKNVERTLALYLSSLQRFRESMLSVPKSSNVKDIKAAILRDEADKKLGKELDDLGYKYSNEEEANLQETIVVEHAFSFFRIFKVFIGGDLMFTRKQREMSREYFFKVSAIDALRVMTVELHFIYEVLHTKALVIRYKWSYIFRFIAFADIVIAFVLFNRLKKHWLPKLDVKITYILLSGGIALEVIALFMLFFSDWTAVDIDPSSFLHKLVSATYSLRKPRFTKCEAESNANVSYTVLHTSLIFRRWSESISACNLLSMLLNQSPRNMYKCNRCWGIIAFSIICRFPFRMAEKIISCFHRVGEAIAKCCGLKKRTLLVSNTKYMSKNPFVNKLWVFIFEEVRRKSKNADDLIEVKKIFEDKGASSLKSSIIEIDCSHFLSYVANTNFDDRIFALHIATELWYNVEKPFKAGNDEREFSKILSDYMFYLLINQSDVVSAVAGISQIASALMLVELQEHMAREIKDVEGLCKTWVDVDFFKELLWVMLGRDVVIEMENLGERKWKVMSKVWVETLSYAAVQIKGEAHVQVLSKGGELLAFVWLLMVHFGCFYKPEWGIAF